MKDPRVGVGVAAIMERADRRILIMRRSETVSHGKGQYSLPGGWIDWGEDPKDAVLREVWEEVGVNGRNPIFAGYTADTHEIEGLHVICMFFRIPGWDGDPTIREPDKADSLDWLLRREIKYLPLFAPLAHYVAEGQL